MAIHTVKRIVNGQPFSIETGRMAKQADGAVVVRMGDTMVLVAVVAAQKKTDRDFFSAHGRVPREVLRLRPHSRRLFQARGTPRRARDFDLATHRPSHPAAIR